MEVVADGGKDVGVRLMPLDSKLSLLLGVLRLAGIVVSGGVSAT